jgi:hypothetical protein
MGGGILQLSLMGNADIILTGAPQVTFFKQVYRRHSLFSVESIRQAFQGTADFGRRCTCPLSRQADLVSHVWLEVHLPDLSDFYYGQTPEASAAVPGIFSARFTSSTSVRVKLIPPTDGLSVEYEVSIINTATDEVVEAAPTSSTIVDVSGLQPGAPYAAVARRIRSNGDRGNPSAPTAVVSVRWCNSIGHALLRTVSLEIGGATIDHHVSEWFDIMTELMMPEEKRQGLETMIGKYPAWDLYDNSFGDARTMFIPLQFFFNRSNALSIPLVSLAFHDIKINFDFRDYTELIKSDIPISSLLNSRGATPSADITLWSSMIFIDTEERRRYTSMPQEMLIEQLQFLGDAPIIVDSEEPNLTRKISLNFSHPVKEIVWVYTKANAYNTGLAPSQYPVQGNDYFNYDLPAPLENEDPIARARIQINGHDRFAERSGSYFRLVQPYLHHTRIPKKKVYVYSYALSPEDLTQPNGSCNYSRVDTSHLVITLNPKMMSGAFNGRIRVFGTNWQVLRVASGMAGLAFAGG